MIAEDLGLITPEVDQLRHSFDMPGMRILQFGFNDRGAAYFVASRIDWTAMSMTEPSFTTDSP